jgi:hypothetical protein
MITWEGFGRGLIDVLSHNIPIGTNENHEKSPVRIVDGQTEVWTENLANTSTERYRWADTQLSIFGSQTYTMTCAVYISSNRSWCLSHVCSDT